MVKYQTVVLTDCFTNTNLILYYFTVAIMYHYYDCSEMCLFKCVASQSVAEVLCFMTIEWTGKT